MTRKIKQNCSCCDGKGYIFIFPKTRKRRQRRDKTRRRKGSPHKSPSANSVSDKSLYSYNFMPENSVSSKSAKSPLKKWGANSLRPPQEKYPMGLPEPLEFSS